MPLLRDADTPYLPPSLAEVGLTKSFLRASLWHKGLREREARGLLTRMKFVPRKLQEQFVDHTGYVTLFPLLLRLLAPNSPKLGALLDLLGDPAYGIWSDYGLRSLALSDKLYQQENAPGDAPYWRGPIWINCNFLAVQALKHYANVAGRGHLPAHWIWRKRS